MARERERRHEGESLKSPSDSDSARCKVKPTGSMGERSSKRQREGDKDKRELDDLFAYGKVKKAKRDAAGQQSSGQESTSSQAGKTSRKGKGKSHSGSDKQPEGTLKPKGVTDEGWRIYSWSDLVQGAGQAKAEKRKGKPGTTPECPFDCWCCFA